MSLHELTETTRQNNEKTIYGHTVQNTSVASNSFFLFVEQQECWHNTVDEFIYAEHKNKICISLTSGQRIFKHSKNTVWVSYNEFASISSTAVLAQKHFKER